MEKIMEDDMKTLFEEITLKNIKLRNRIVMAPMCMYSADVDGNANDWHYTHYETRSIGGCGLVIIEATAVEGRGRISENDLGIWSDSHIDGLKTIVRKIKKHGAKAGIQLAHAGRKCVVKNESVIAASAIHFDESDDNYKLPEAMNLEAIEEVVKAFEIGAERASKAGFDLIEIHAAHGYLINTFLSPLTNKRTDDYGYHNQYGTLFLRRIVESVRKVWSNEKPLQIRISASDYDANGNTPEKIATALETLSDLEIDVINVSSGGVIPIGIRSYDGYQLKMADTIKNKTSFQVVAGGRIKTVEMAEEAIKNERADFIFLGRQLLIDPYFPIKAASALGVEIDYTPVQYKRWK